MQVEPSEHATLEELISQIETRFGIKVAIDDDEPPLLTSAGVTEFIRKKVGLPVTVSRLAKDRMTGRAPPPDVFYGRVGLSTIPTALRYAISLLTSTPTRLAGSRQGRLDVEADRGDAS